MKLLYTFLFAVFVIFPSHATELPTHTHVSEIPQSANTPPKQPSRNKQIIDALLKEKKDKETKKDRLQKKRKCTIKINKFSIAYGIIATIYILCLHDVPKKVLPYIKQGIEKFERWLYNDTSKENID
ncbi:MAG TPA: hypothetical protein VEK38_03710 [Candidatus Bathyarchaeia archaeon]|nr:hypothetical protein [Candidatus Bathyarchaeia archaeon]